MTAATTAAADERASRAALVSPVAAVMVLLSVVGAVQFYRHAQVTFDVVDTSVVLGAALVWACYGAIGIAVIVLLQSTSPAKLAAAIEPYLPDKSSSS